MFIFELDAEEPVARLQDSLDDAVRAALVRIVGDVGHTAQQTHPWQNRTGELQANTHGSNVVNGDFWNGTLSADVLGDTEYGEYLEEKPQWAWLGPAWDVNEPFAADELDRALGEAARQAGWS